MNPLANLCDAAIGRMICHSGRSWWQAEYAGGKILSEWGTQRGISLPLRSRKPDSSRWEDIPKAGMIRLTLFAPNGKAAVLCAPEGHKFFQLKVGSLRIGRGASSRICEAQIIGVVEDGNGNCQCHAWETAENRLVSFRDNVTFFGYRQIGALALDVQGLKF